MLLPIAEYHIIKISEDSYYNQIIKVEEWLKERLGEDKLFNYKSVLIQDTSGLDKPLMHFDFNWAFVQENSAKNKPQNNDVFVLYGEHVLAMTFRTDLVAFQNKDDAIHFKMVWG